VRAGPGDTGPPALLLARAAALDRGGVGGFVVPHELRVLRTPCNLTPERGRSVAALLPPLCAYVCLHPSYSLFDLPSTPLLLTCKGVVGAHSPSYLLDHLLPPALAACCRRGRGGRVPHPAPWRRRVCVPTSSCEHAHQIANTSFCSRCLLQARAWWASSPSCALAQTRLCTSCAQQ